MTKEYEWCEAERGGLWSLVSPIGAARVRRVRYKGWEGDTGYSSDYVTYYGEVKPVMIRPTLAEAQADAIDALIREGEKAIERLREITGDAS